ncbi:uncharacterized protein LTR77_008783 [Saxophila tyrrhenica]|uniref:Uncharacterized protein n=1 Tax=Saxophila tyrrhenica TaxID=1690608 RepID=A0AAV9P095_9PEZI|nr:hypothetical protein LTR77_008783 [Saxophila tyrrhenica]
MESLPLFGFARWMAGGSADAPGESGDVRSSGNHTQISPQTRLRQAGIRERTDESFDLPKSGDIMQHLAESYSSRTQRAPHSNQPRSPSCGATSAVHTTQHEFEMARDAYDTIEAEIDTLKDDILRMRQEADLRSTGPNTEQELAADRFLSTRSKRWLAQGSKVQEESAAVRLQRLHQGNKTNTSGPIQAQQRSSVPPSSMDFPALSQHVPSRMMSPTEEPAQGRKLSYAHAATGPDSSATVPLSVSNLIEHSKDDLRHTKDEQDSVIILASDMRNIRSSIEPSPDTRSPGDNTGTKLPRFAQPTKSFARRAGETLRKDSASIVPRSPGESSPGKTMKGREPLLSTAKRAAQHQKKRSSLPGDWVNNAGGGGNKTPDKAPKSNGKPGENASPKVTGVSPSAEGRQLEKGSQAKENVAKMKLKAKDVQAATPKQKRSYMAPTTAAAQRGIVKPGNPKPQPAVAKQITEVRLDAAISARPTQTISASDTSSVCFVLDRSNGSGSNSPRNTSNRSSHIPVPKIQQSPVRACGLSKPLPAGSWSSAPGLTVNTGNVLSQATTSLPDVRNTTAKRRTSHGSLLTPIVACLDAKGLLKKDTNNAVIEAYLQNVEGSAISSPSPLSALQSLPGSPTRRSDARSEISTAQYARTSGTFVPPHIRLREPSAASTVTGSVAYQPMGPPALDNRSTAPFEVVRRDSVMQTDSPVLGKSKSMRTALLRPTAAIFEPRTMTTAVNVPKGLAPSLEYMPQEQWSSLSPEQKSEVNHAPAMAGFDARNTFSRQSFHQAATWHTNAFSPANQAGAPYNGYARSNGVQAGQRITPSFSPGKKNVNWMLRDLDGTETPIKFGRAPPPSSGRLFTPTTPAAATLSDDTTPIKTPFSPNGWRIGSAFSKSPYGWKGGDGKEIRFVGYGPHAERDPNTVVDFDFQGKTASFSTALSNGFEEGNSLPSTGVAPKSQRQWAEKLGYQSVPCGNVEITHAVEQMPFVSQLAGYCYDCSANN